MNKKLAAVLVSAAIAGSGYGAIAVAGASSGGSTDTGVTTTTTQPGAPRPDRANLLKGVLDPLVADGTLTQAQEDKVIAALKAAVPDGAGGPHGGFGRGPGMGHDLDAAAKAIGITADQLRTELQGGGKSLADIAKAHGVDPATVVSALVAAHDTQLADAVKAGKLTQAQADKIKADETQRITDRVNGVHPEGDGPHFGGRHFGGDDDDSGSTSTTQPAAN